VAGSWRKLNNKELYKLCASPYIIRAKKSRRMEWKGHTVRVEEYSRSIGGQNEGKRTAASFNKMRV
jgi:hypothetical protein